MNVLILGGGPGGLYGAILLKKARPDWSIAVYERNPPDATYGWGIVFSDRTLGSFREADSKTYKDITDHFVVWDVVEIRRNDAVTRCGGNVFSGMSRKVLLEILQRRCRELGVELRFRADVTDLSTLPDHDVLIAADGANSLIRRAFADAFQPKVEWGKARYAWFGTTQVFDAFTFLFRESEAGLFQAHIYPHVGTISTMVVECDEATWRRAGLDRASELESLAWCEKVFAPDLRGRPMLANKSDWLSFPTVRNRTWRHRNVVLLGDAAHTAHFGIGSGTKLAMEDAIALANAFERHGADFAAAADEYELERRPTVESLQEAALESMEYFENTRRYRRFEPLPFAFHLLTRSSRTSYDELRRRDPSFVDAVDRWFFASADGSDLRGARVVAPPPMFTPIRVRDVVLSNRVVLSPTPAYSARDGVPDEGESARLLRCALGGAGLVLTDLVAVAPEGRVTPGCPGLYRSEQAAALRRLCEFVHARADAKIGVQLGHAGRRGATRPRTDGVDRPLRTGAWSLVSASAIPSTPRSAVPREMGRSDMDAVLASFVRAARFAEEAGADWIQLHFGQGYLLWSFLSPLGNRRSDGYGGTLENRARFPLEVIDAVRVAWPETKPVSVALSATDWTNGGFGVDDAVA
ncbi:MAG: FAD-dependent monooxygenase, partial [Candidatus Binatia bacterium]